MRTVFATLPNAKTHAQAAADTTNMMAMDTKKRMMGRSEKSMPLSATMAKSLTKGNLEETMAEPRMAARSLQGITALIGLTLLPNTTKNEWNLGSGLEKINRSGFKTLNFIVLSNSVSFVMRPFCLVESCSQDAAANAGVLSVYLTTILCNHLYLFIDIERENIR